MGQIMLIIVYKWLRYKYNRVKKNESKYSIMKNKYKNKCDKYLKQIENTTWFKSRTKLRIGDKVLIDKNRGVGKIVQIHTDDSMYGLYYSVLLESEKEIQTTIDHINIIV